MPAKNIAIAGLMRAVVVAVTWVTGATARGGASPRC